MGKAENGKWSATSGIRRLELPRYLIRPYEILRGYRPADLRPDVVAGLTIAVVLLPQAIAYALIAELPPQTGLYAAMTAGVVGAMWGSSFHVHTGPTNAISLLVLSSLAVVAAPGSPEFVLAAGLMAVMAGVLQLVLGAAGLGALVNFVSHSVIVGFASGAGVLIALKQLRYLFGLDVDSSDVAPMLRDLVSRLPESHLETLLVGGVTVGLLVFLRWWRPLWPGALIGMVAASLMVVLMGLEGRGVAVLGELPRSLPPLASLPLLDLGLISELSVGALAVAAIGLVETTAVSQSIAAQTRQRMDSNQEFVGQGLANIVAGVFSGYACSGSFTHSAVNFKAGGKTPVSSAVSSLVVLAALLLLAPFAAYLPRAALAAVLIVTGVGMIDRHEIVRILRGSRGDAIILAATFLGTLFLHIEFAVLVGILLSFAFYIMRTSVPEVEAVLPDADFRHFRSSGRRPQCPQLGIMEIHGDLYFGAVGHVENVIREQREEMRSQRFLLLRMKGVHHCDFSGINALENIVRLYREGGGDVFLTRLERPVLRTMISTDFHRHLGRDHFLERDLAVDYLFHRVIDPAVCIYECPVRAFRECQNLPKREFALEAPTHTEASPELVSRIGASQLWNELHGEQPPTVIDVREPREFHGGHVPGAHLMPLPLFLSRRAEIPTARKVVLVCRGGRRSGRAAAALIEDGRKNVFVLDGGMLSWEASDLLEAMD